MALTALWNLTQLEIEQGHLRRAAELCQQALQLAVTSSVLPGKDTQGMPPPAAAGAYVNLGVLSYEQNNLDAALRYLEDGLKLGEQGADLAILAVGYLNLARIKQAQADLLSAWQFARRAEQLAQRYNSPYWIAQAAATQAWLWIVEGQLEAARRWAQEYKLNAHDELNYLYEVEYFILARLLIAEKKAVEAATLLERLRQAAETGGRMGRVIEALALHALAFHAQGQKQPAISSLEQALALAEPEGYVRLFLDVGEPMIELLSEVRSQKSVASSQRSVPKGGYVLVSSQKSVPRGGYALVSQAYIANLLTAYEQTKALHPSVLIPQPLIEPLSERELELVALIATGMSNSEIAEKLVVTVGTVKWHLNNIYGKLDVRSRTQAVAKARELGLL
ncbi:MAG: hypothetical protein HYR94_08155 [Chloroflexi bacterium]|nr:hypothetical protein [Chloroflexota bacterium]